VYGRYRYRYVVTTNLINFAEELDFYELLDLDAAGDNETNLNWVASTKNVSKINL